MAGGILGAIAICLARIAPAAPAAVPEIQPPAWSGLSAEQKKILAPLAGEWNQMDDTRRRKWLGIAERYPKMPPEEQERVQRRMKSWSELSPAERQRARSQYQDLQKISPEQRQELQRKWEQYDALPDDEKKRLKEQAKTPAKPGAEGRR